MKKLAAACAAAVVAATLATLAILIAVGGGHSPAPQPTAGSSWAGLGNGLLGSILDGL